MNSDYKKLKEENEMLVKKVAQLEEERKFFLQKQIKNHKNLQNNLERIDLKLTKQSELVDRIFSNPYIGIANMDLSFNYIRVNQTFSQIDNKEVEYFKGKNHFEIFPNEKNKKVFEEVYLTGKPFFTYGKPFGNQFDQKQNFWDWCLLPVTNKDNITTELILILLNVSDRIISKIQLERAKTELLHAKRLSDIGKLAATVAHELRTPLAVIETAIYNIEKKCPDRNIEIHLNNIERKLLEAEEIISNLLFYSKIKMPNFQKTDIGDLLNNCILQVKNRFINKKAAILKKNLEKKIFLHVDPIQLQEVFNNILVNSFQAIFDKNGEIRIEMKELKQFIKIDVIDNGTGIEDYDLELVFDPFFTKKSRGTGLGLSICKEILHLHQGEISIKSVAGNGTTVEIILPKNQD